MAGLFESYKFHSLEFVARSQSPTSEPGYLALIPDYQSTDSAPTSKLQALEYEDTVRGPPWTDFSHRSTLRNLQKRQSYFVRTGSIPSTSSSDLFDTGRLYVAAGNNTDAAVKSELWVKYDVELMTPQYNGPSSSGKVVGTTGLSTTDSIGTNAVATGGIDVTFGTASMTFNKPFTGIVINQHNGTGLSGSNAISLSGNGSYTAILNTAVNSNIYELAYGLLDAREGDVLSAIQTTLTTFTSSTWRFAPYDLALGSDTLSLPSKGDWRGWSKSDIQIDLSSGQNDPEAKAVYVNGNVSTPTYSIESLVKDLGFSSRDELLRALG
jgi:hypothetical protein